MAEFIVKNSDLDLFIECIHQAKNEIGYIAFDFEDFTSIVSCGKTEFYTAVGNDLTTVLENLICQFTNEEPIKNAFLAINVDMNFIQTETIDDIVAKCRDVVNTANFYCNIYDNENKESCAFHLLVNR